MQASFASLTSDSSSEVRCAMGEPNSSSLPAAEECKVGWRMRYIHADVQHIPHRVQYYETYYRAHIYAYQPSRGPAVALRYHLPHGGIILTKLNRITGTWPVSLSLPAANRPETICGGVRGFELSGTGSPRPSLSKRFTDLCESASES